MKRTLFALIGSGAFFALVFGLLASPTPQSGEVYVGEKKCKKCHIKQHKTWQETKHAQAYDYLGAAHQKEEKCLKCHTTAYGAGGFVSIEDTPDFTNIQCEQCHGAGGTHLELMEGLRKDKVDKEQYPADKKIDREPRSCTDCHNPHTKHEPVEKAD